MTITVKLPGDQQVALDKDHIVVGRDPDCDVWLPDEQGVQSRHAIIKKVAGKWLIQSEGDWLLQVGGGVPGRKCWLNTNDVIHLTETGPDIVFVQGSLPASSHQQFSNGEPPVTFVEHGVSPYAGPVHLSDPETGVAGSTAASTFSADVSRTLAPSVPPLHHEDQPRHSPSPLPFPISAVQQQRPSPKPLVARMAIPACWAGVIVIAIGTIWFALEWNKSRQIRFAVEFGDELWGKGAKVQAVEQYRPILPILARDDQAAVIYQRVIEVDLEKGNRESAKSLMHQALGRGVILAFDSREAAVLLAEIKSKSTVDEADDEDTATATVARKTTDDRNAGKKHAKHVESTSLQPEQAAEAASGTLNTTPVLTEEFYPYRKGATHTVETKRFAIADFEMSETEEWEYQSGGTIQRREIANHARQLSSGESGSRPAIELEPTYHRVRNGFVETGKKGVARKEIEWSPDLKMGAQQGDSWKNEVSGITDAYTLKEFAIRDVSPQIVKSGRVFCAVIEKTMLLGKTKFKGVSIYGRGVGLLHQESFMEEGGKMKLQWRESLVSVEPVIKDTTSSDSTSSSPPSTEPATKRKVDPAELLERLTKSSGQPTGSSGRRTSQVRVNEILTKVLDVSGTPNSLAISDDGRFLLVDRDLWDIDEGRELNYCSHLKPITIGNRGYLHGINFDYRLSTAGLLACVYPEPRRHWKYKAEMGLPEVIVYSLTTGSPVKAFSVSLDWTRREIDPFENGYDYALQWSPAGKSLCAYRVDGSCVVLMADVTKPGKPLYLECPDKVGPWARKIRGKNRFDESPLCLGGVAFSPNSRLMAVCYAKIGLRIFDVTSGRLLRSLEFPESPKVHETEIRGFSADGAFLVTRTNPDSDATTTIWDTSSWNPVRTLDTHWGNLTLAAPRCYVTWVQQQGGYRIELRDLASDSVIKSSTADFPAGGDVKAVSGDGRVAVVNALCGEDGGHIQLWDLTTGNIIAALGRLDGPRLLRAAISRKGDRIAFVCLHRTGVGIWDASSGKTITVDELAGRIEAAAGSENARTSYRHRLAPAVTQELFDHLRPGMDQDAVWKVLGGKCHKQKSDTVVESHGIATSNYWEVIEYYPAEETGMALVLQYYGTSTKPPLKEKMWVSNK